MATTDLARLVVRMEAQTAKYQKELEKANQKLGRFEKRQKKSIANISRGFKTLGTAVAAIGIGRLLSQVTRATAAQEQATAQLQQGLVTTGEAAGYNLQQLINYAQELQKVTTFGDEQLIAAQAQLISFTQITGNEFQRTLELAADLSVRFGQDLKSSVLQLGKALNDPVANLGALSRSGIQFSKDQKELIKSLFETGRQAEAQRVILQELEVQFGGSARAARDTFGGALEGLNNAFGDLLEADAGLPEAKRQVESLTAVLANPGTQDAVDTFVAALARLAGLSFEGVAQLVQLGTKMGESVAHLAGFSDELSNIDSAISEIESKIGTSALNRTVLFGNDGIFKIYSDEELQAKLAELKSRRDEILGGDSVLGPVSTSAERLSAPKLPPLEEIEIPQIERLDSTALELEGAKKLEQGMNEIYERIYSHRADLAARTAKFETDTAATLIDKTLALQISGSKKAAKIQKALSVAKATMAGIESIQQAWALPWPANIPAAALAAATMAANLAAITSTDITGFATGGSFEVGGKGGTDANLVAFKATRGERVTVSTPGQQDAMGGAVPEVHIHANDTQTGLDFIMNNRGGIAAAIRSIAADQGRVSPI